MAKGIYVYQQIVKTTSEWESNTDIFPQNVWLFEKLDNGRFNLAISDGVHTYAELQKIMSDISVVVKTDTDTEYILTITTTAESFDTPNLIGPKGDQGIQGIQGEKGDKGDKGDTGTVGVMLNAEPTEDTLTYIVGDVTYNFELGMSAIYTDSESDNGYGLSFFMGTTAEGKAIWGKGGGGAGSLNETVMISLVSNQDEAASPDADLLGKSVHVIYGDQDKELVWQGEVMKTTVPMNMTYQVVFPTDDRYKCPAQQEYIALAGETREVKGL